MNGLQINSLRNPPVGHFCLYWACVGAAILLLIAPGFLPILTIVPLIIVSHGAHEAIHGTLVPTTFQSKALTALSQWTGFAMIGQNFLLMQWSHKQHHRFGRQRAEDTIEQAPYVNSSYGTLAYYCLLCGAAAVYYEIAGYLYPLFGDRYHILSRDFRKSHYRCPRYIFGQLAVLFTSVALLAIGGWKFVLVRLMFLLYWGMSQNVAHYGLQVHDSLLGRTASRTYRGPAWVEALVYRTAFYHWEHHLFPFIPGPHLNNPLVAAEAGQRFAPINSPTPSTWRGYLSDYFGQLRGPIRSGRGRSLLIR